MKLPRIAKGAGRWAVLTLVLALALGLCAIAAEAGPRHAAGAEFNRPPMQRLLDRHAERLDLDAPTRARIEEISRQALERGREHAEKLRALYREQGELLDREPPDEAAILRQVERIGAMRLESEKLRLRTLLRIRALLTPEQRRRLLEMHREERPRLRDRLRERRRGAEPGPAEP